MILKLWLYARYGARGGDDETLGSAALQFYAGVVSMFLPIPAENQPELIADLEGDPFVGHTLSSATCELYHRYGMFLAPLNLDIDVLLTSMTEIKPTAKMPQADPMERPAETASPAEPAHVERVTKKKAKDPKKVAACSNSFRQPMNHYVHLSA